MEGIISTYLPDVDYAKRSLVVVKRARLRHFTDRWVAMG